jgi:arabinofuranan 3-O-arabinosyltransferase
MSSGPATYLGVPQTFNTGWTASLDGHRLRAVSLDGWEQGWVVPAGAAGTVTMTFTPDHTFRWALAIGALFLVLLVVLALAGGSSNAAALGPRRRLRWGVLAAVAAVVVFCVGGVAVLLLVPLVWAGRRWGAGLLAATAGLAFLAAGVVVAAHSFPIPFGHPRAEGAFGVPAQGLALLALSALLSAVVVEDGRWPRRRAAPAGAPAPRASEGAVSSGPAPPPAAGETARA